LVNSGSKPKSFLDINVVLNICNEIKEMNILNNEPIILTGGEVSLHPQIVEIIKGINSLGFKKINISTTGSNFTENQISEIAPLINIASFSIDGDEEYHNSFRQNDNIYNKTLWAIKKFKEYGVTNTSIQTTVSKENFNYLDEIGMLAKQLNVEHIRLVPLLPIGRATKCLPENIFFDNIDYAKLLEKIIKFNGYYVDKSTSSILDRRSFLLEHPEKVLGLSGLNSFEVDAFGQLYPHGICSDDYIIGNVNNEKLYNLLNKFFEGDVYRKYIEPALFIAKTKTMRNMA
jgi:MoaA/NifB/PqqE/SkfB family radical SAM enzyme